MCSICWDEVQDPSVQLACKHTFHYGCIAEWGKRNHACPLCRQAFTARVEPETPAWVPDDLEVRGEHFLTAVLSSVTVLRCLAIVCPNFVERMFEPQIKLGRTLSGFWKRHSHAAATVVAMLLICS